MINSLRWTVLRAALLVTASITACSAVEARAPRPLPEAYDLYYGVYLNGSKVGWMRTQLAVKKLVEMTTELSASVGGMGQVSQVRLREQRSYDRSSGALQALSFSQSAATGEVTVKGRNEKGVLYLEIRAGEATQTQAVQVTETLEDALAAERLARSATVGATATVQRFDPSIQKAVRLTHTVAAIEERVLGGVKVGTVRIESRYPELGIDETSWADSTGKMLESQVGGFFQARLEAEDVARRLDYQQDLLVSAVVRSPVAIERQQELGAVKLRITGFGETLPPSSERQLVERVGAEVHLSLRKDPAPQVALPLSEKSAEARANLEATPFIQADARELREAARKVVGDAKDVLTATTRLAHYVAGHVRDEYVPAYSNALEAFKSGRGDCTEHSILFVALSRAVGIPARVAVGIAYWPPGNGFGWHAWAEVYAGGKWYAVDPTWDEPIADATHIKLADGGPAEQARIVMLLGRLRITHVETQKQ